MKDIPIAVIEDNAVFVKAIKGLFKRPGSGVECLAVYTTAEEALKKIVLIQPDIILVDIHLPGMSGIDCIAQLKKIRPELICLVLTTFDRKEMIFDSLKAGASGYLLKRSSAEEIIQAIMQAKMGGAPMTPQIARQVVSFFYKAPAPQTDSSLNSVEREVIELLARGLLYKEVAEELRITIDIVRRHVKKIYEKLHAHTRMEAVNKYRNDL